MTWVRLPSFLLLALGGETNDNATVRRTQSGNTRLKQARRVGRAVTRSIDAMATATREVENLLGWTRCLAAIATVPFWVTVVVVRRNRVVSQVMSWVYVFDP